MLDSPDRISSLGFVLKFATRFLRKRAWTACKVVTYLQTARMILSVVAYGESDSLE